MKRSIESKCLSLLMRQQPVARDLRMITASLKVVTDIARIGDICCDMAELVGREKHKSRLIIFQKIWKLWLILQESRNTML